MKIRTLLASTLATAVASTLMLSPPAQAQSLGETSGANAVLGVSPSTPDFVTQAAISDMFEIESSRLAMERGNAETKAFATQMVADHTKTSEELKALLKSAGIDVSPPTALDEAHRAMLDDLSKLNGAEFDEAYRDDQEEVHEAAVSLFERYGEEGDTPALKTWAAKTLPALEHHLEMAEALDG